MEFDAAVDELGTLVETLEREGDERALMLLELVDAIHRPGLERLAAGELEHPLAQGLLAMYELVPFPDEVYVEEALEEVRPYLEEHGGEVELVEVEDGRVHLRMGGACRSGTESAAALREGIERAVHDRYPAFQEIVAHEPDAGMALPLAAAPSEPPVPQPDPDGGHQPVPPARAAETAQPASGGPRVLSIEGLERPQRLKGPVFSEIGVASEIPPGGRKVVDADGTSILVLNVEGDFYGFKNVCAFDGRSELDGARLTGTVLVCPWHNCAYDARSGKRVDGDDAPGLAVVPVAVRDGSLQVAVNVA